MGNILFQNNPKPRGNSILDQLSQIRRAGPSNMVLDQMCQDKIDAKNEQIAALRQEIALKDLAASQNLQTAQLVADNAAQTAALEQYLAPVPRPAYVVQNPNCCQQNYGCGCGTF